MEKFTFLKLVTISSFRIDAILKLIELYNVKLTMKMFHECDVTHVIHYHLLK